jgi:ankyrin repeat protein
MTFHELWRSISEKSGTLELSKYLESGGDVNVRHPVSSWTLLHLAVEHMNYPLIEALASFGVDLNARDSQSGWTPLHLAVDVDIDSVWQANHSFEKITFSTVCLLISLGANLNHHDSNEFTPRNLVARYDKNLQWKFDDLVENCMSR